MFQNSALFSANLKIVNRLDKKRIERHISSVEKKLKRNTCMQYAVCGALGTIGLASSGYVIYNTFFAKKPSIIPVPVVGQSPIITSNESNSIEKRLTDIESRIERHDSLLDRLKELIIGKALPWPLNWGKTIGLFGLQTIGSMALMNAYSSATRYWKNVFKTRKIKWYITMNSKIGAFIKSRDFNGFLHEDFRDGVLIREIKRTLTTLEEVTDKQRCEQLGRMVYSACSSLLKEITHVLAFMQLTIDKKIVEPSYKSEAEDCIHYLMNFANGFADDIEQSVESKIANPESEIDLSSTIQKFMLDFQTRIDSFARISKEERAYF